MNLVYGPAHRESFVAQWLEHPTSVQKVIGSIYCSRGIRFLLCPMLVTCWSHHFSSVTLSQYYHYSTARAGIIKEHVRKFLMYEATVYGDTTFMEFTDGFLTEHVKSVSVCDTEMVSKDRQVYFSISQLNTFCLINTPCVCIRLTPVSNKCPLLIDILHDNCTK